MSKPVFKIAVREELQDVADKFFPTKGEPKATGYDVAAATENREPIVVKPGQWVKIKLGFRAFLPEGWWLDLRPRSSTSIKKNIHALYGVIDETYEGEFMFCGQYLPDHINNETELVINFGDKIGQVIPMKRKSVRLVDVSNEEYDDACKERGGTRGAGGFGSTGK